MPQLWMYAGAEAVKMATQDRFDIAEWLKMIKNREVACRSNNEMTKTKLPNQVQQIQISKYRPQQRETPAINPWPCCTYHKNNWTYQCRHMDADQRHQIIR